MKELSNKRQVYISKERESNSLSFLYRNILGRLCLKVATRHFVSKLGGKFLNTKFSTRYITPFVTNNNIDLSEYEEKEFTSYNAFFTRKIKEGKRIVDMNKNAFIAPCDSKLSVYNISKDSVFKIKNSFYSTKDLLGGDDIYKEYDGGLCLIFRLAVDDYHRYCYIDNGTKEDNVYIKGEFHTVQPIALEKYNIYKRNSREYTVLHTENFGDVIQIEVGALMVGKISNHHGVYSFKKGEEKGMFEFGGSTIVLLVKKDIIDLDHEFFENTNKNIETIVKYGERIGIKNDKIS